MQSVNVGEFLLVFFIVIVVVWLTLPYSLTKVIKKSTRPALKLNNMTFQNLNMFSPSDLNYPKLPKLLNFKMHEKNGALFRKHFFEFFRFVMLSRVSLVWKI